MTAHIRKTVRSEDHAKFIAEDNGWDLIRMLDDLEDDRGLEALFYTRPYGYTLKQEGAMERCLND